MRTVALLSFLLVAFQADSQTARDFFNELYKAGGLDRMADKYVCFDENPANQNFFIFGESKDLRDFLTDNGDIKKYPRAQREMLLKSDWLIVRDYAKGIPFNTNEFYDKDGESWVGEAAIECQEFGANASHGQLADTSV